MAKLIYHDLDSAKSHFICNYLYSIVLFLTNFWHALSLNSFILLSIKSLFNLIAYISNMLVGKQKFGHLLQNQIPLAGSSSIISKLYSNYLQCIFLECRLYQLMCRHKMSHPELLHEMFGGVHSKLLYMLMHTDGRLQSQSWNTCVYRCYRQFNKSSYVS